MAVTRIRLSKMVDDGIARDLKNPSLKPSIIAERVEALVNSQEHILQDVVYIGGRIDSRPNEQTKRSLNTHQTNSVSEECRLFVISLTATG